MGLNKIFEQGYKYVFSRKLFKKDLGYFPTWETPHHNKVVDVYNHSTGTIRGTKIRVCPEWCKKLEYDWKPELAKWFKNH